MKEKIGIIADDFTGASDIASFMDLSGSKTILLNEIPPRSSDFDYSSYDVIVIALKSRSIDPMEAIKQTKDSYDFLYKNNMDNIYFKYASTFDSTEHGNIGPVLDYLLEEIEQKFTLIVPSFPDNKRIVKDGILYVDGKKIEETHMRNHPITPMTESELKVLIEKQSKYKAYNLSIKDIKYYIDNQREFNQYISRLSEENDHFYIVPDYYENRHGQLIAQLFLDLELYSGASVFGGWINQVKNNQIINDYPTLPLSKFEENYKPKRGIILAGSLSKATRSQINFFKKNNYPYFEVKNEDIYKDYKNVEYKIKEFILNNINRPMLIHTETKKNGKAIDYLLEEIMAASALFALNNNIENIVAAGGETSGAIVKNIATNRFQISTSISPGVPVLLPIEENKHTKLVLKSGNFGEKDFFEKSLYIMERIKNE